MEGAPPPVQRIQLLGRPASGKTTPLRAPTYLKDNRVQRLELDRMVNPPALLVATDTGASMIRVLP